MFAVRKVLFRFFPRAYSRLSVLNQQLYIRGQEKKRGRFDALAANTPSDLLSNHYAVWVSRDDAKRFAGLKVAFDQLDGRPSTIVETGSSAWGIDSSRLFDSYVRRFGGQFFTFDVRNDPSERLKGQLGANSKAIVSDSLVGLQTLANSQYQVDLLYLDSLDLDWSSPEPSAKHCLREWHAAKKMLGSGSIVAIDDTPAELSYVPKFDNTVAQSAKKYLDKTGTLPGKGALVLREIADSQNIEILHHSYNLVFRVR